MPQARLAGVRMGGGDSVEVRLVVFNPNRLAIGVSQAEYALLVADETLASGARAEPVRLLALDSVELPLPLAVRLNRVIGLLSGTLPDSAECRFSGEYSARVLLGRQRGRFGQVFQFSIRDQLRSLSDGLLDANRTE